MPFPLLISFSIQFICPSDFLHQLNPWNTFISWQRLQGKKHVREEKSLSKSFLSFAKGCGWEQKIFFSLMLAMIKKKSALGWLVIQHCWVGVNINSIDDLSHNFPVGCSQFVKRLSEHKLIWICSACSTLSFYDILNNMEDFCLYFVEAETLQHVSRKGSSSRKHLAFVIGET